MIVGRGMKSDSISNRFVEFAGGWDAAIVVIPTASGRDDYTQNSEIAGSLLNRGVSKVTVLHTNDRKMVDSDSFVKPRGVAKAV